MAGSITDVKSIFGKALELASPAERAAYLAEACGDDPRLRAEVEALLRAGQAARRVLRRPAVPRPAPTIDQPVSERPGDVIGPYKLLEQIGEGGMGVGLDGRADRAGPPQGRAEADQGRDGHAGRCSPGSRPSGRPWR